MSFADPFIPPWFPRENLAAAEFLILAWTNASRLAFAGA
jgi:hypothetical protein